MATLADALDKVDPERVADADAGAWLTLAGQVERLGAGLRLRMADRATRATDWVAEGYRSGAAWVAAAAGTSLAEARSTLATSGDLQRFPMVSRAASRGALSADQVALITEAACVDPARQEDLIEAAAGLGTDGLRRVARDLRSAPAVGDAPAMEHPLPSGTGSRSRPRYLRVWSEAQGLVRFAGAYEAADGALFMAAVRSRAAFVADEAMAAGLEPEGQAAYDADALLALVTGDLRHATFEGNVASGRGLSTVVLHAQLDALPRGRSGAVGTCEIGGLGPVPASVVDAWAGDACLRLVVEDGDREVGVTELGPAVPAAVRRALEQRDSMCVVPGCTVAIGLRTVFWRVPFGQGGSADLSNLARLCRFHHRLKTAEGYELVGGPGRWEWRPPP